MTLNDARCVTMLRGIRSNTTVIGLLIVVDMACRLIGFLLRIATVEGVY